MDVSQAGPELCSVMGLSVFSAGLGVICNLGDRTKTRAHLEIPKQVVKRTGENKPPTFKGGRQKHKVSELLMKNDACMLTYRCFIHLLDVSKIWQGSAFDPIMVLKLGPWNFVCPTRTPEGLNLRF